MQPPRPYVIAHRGASGYLPEHTREAYAYAHALGADFIELDVICTRDAVPVCLHDRWLDEVSDGPARFPGRMRKDGRLYVADLTFDELRQMQLKERSAGRFPQDVMASAPQSLESVVLLLEGLNGVTGHTTGLFVELKDTRFHAEEKLDVTAAMLETLLARVPEASRERTFIQCFEPEAVRRLHEMGAPFPLLQLIWEDPEYDDMTTETGLDALARYTAGISISKEMLFNDRELCARAKARGLMVNVWTFGAEYHREEFGSMQEELRYVLDHFEIDGIITDHPDRALAVCRGEGGRIA
jgi:glycerophosphoryl diester phosphodiesterase